MDCGWKAIADAWRELVESAVGSLLLPTFLRNKDSTKPRDDTKRFAGAARTPVGRRFVVGLTLEVEAGGLGFIQVAFYVHAEDVCN